MAERQYVITLKNETGEDVSRQTTAPTPDGAGAGQGSKSDEEKSFKFIKGIAFKAFAINPAKKAISTQINTIALRTGYEEKQQEMQFAYSAVNRGATMLGAIGIGAMTGHFGMAIIGSALFIANNAVDYIQRKQEIEYARAVENNSIFLNQIRMGAGSNREGKTR